MLTDADYEELARLYNELLDEGIPPSEAAEMVDHRMCMLIIERRGKGDIVQMGRKLGYEWGRWQ